MKFLANLSVRGKLYLLLGGGILGLAAYGWFASSLTKKVQVGGPIYAEIVKGKDLVADILPPPEYIIESYLTALQLGDQANRSMADELAGRLKQLESDFDTRHEFWLTALADGEMKRTMVEESYEPAREFFRMANDDLLPAVRANDYTRAKKAIEQMTAAYGEHRAAIDRVVVMANDFNAATEKDAGRQVASGTMVLILIAIGTAVAALLFGLVVSGSITRPIGKVVAAAEQMNREFAEFEKVLHAIAQNDLTVPVPQVKAEALAIDSRDEIGRLGQAIEATIETKVKLGSSVTQMQQNLSRVVTQLSDNARELVSAATEIASASEQMSKGARDQSDQVNQVSTAIEEMTVNIGESSQNAGEASSVARGAAETATTGGQVVNESIQAMQQIAATVKHSAESIVKLATSADQIGEIIGVIDDIADQTNLLALNAAIEAARAGEQGRGFAVVADEVRKLAERTGKATGEITSMITGIQKETEQAVEAMESGMQVVDKGRELTDQAGSSLNEIVSQAQRVMAMIQQMAAAAQEQSAASAQIARNVEHISAVTQETATGAEQSAAAAEELSRQAEGLQQMVAKFRVA